MKRLSTTVSLLIAVVMLMPTAGFAGTKNSKPGWLGVNIATVDDNLYVEHNLNLDKPMGVLVLSVVPDSPADQAGLQKDDVLLKFDNTKLDDADQLRDLVAKHHPDDIVNLEFKRDGKTMNLKATLGNQRDVSSFNRLGWMGNNNTPFGGNDFQPYDPDQPVGYLGVTLGNLTDQLGDYFGVPDGNGALITEVVNDSPADKAGLKAGDVIVGIDDDEITSSAQLSRIVRGMSKDDLAHLQIVRDHEKQKIEVAVGEQELRYFGQNMDFDLNNLRRDLQDLPPGTWQWKEYHNGQNQNRSQQDEMNDLRQELQQLKKQFEKMRQDSSK